MNLKIEAKSNWFLCARLSSFDFYQLFAETVA